MRSGQLIDIDAVRAAFSTHVAPLVRKDGRRCAAVSLVLRESTEGLDVLFIERASNPGDFWSGHIAFPGGGVDANDQGPRAAAIRETAEEVGLRLDASGTEYVGHLCDIDTGSAWLVVSAYVFFVATDAALVPEPGEVHDAFWISIAHLLDERHGDRKYAYGGHQPAIRLLPDEHRPVLWGLTYRFVSRFMRLLDHPLP